MKLFKFFHCCPALQLTLYLLVKLLFRQTPLNFGGNLLFLILILAERINLFLTCHNCLRCYIPKGILVHLFTQLFQLFRVETEVHVEVPNHPEVLMFFLSNTLRRFGSPVKLFIHKGLLQNGEVCVIENSVLYLLLLCRRLFFCS